MSTDEQHIALPMLRGAPAYARPPRAVDGTERPFDLDELPIEAYRSDEEREIPSAELLSAYASGRIDVGDPAPPGSDGRPRLRSRTNRLRAFAGRLLGGD